MADENPETPAETPDDPPTENAAESAIENPDGEEEKETPIKPPAGGVDGKKPAQKVDTTPKKKLTTADCIPDTPSGVELPSEEAEKIITSMLSILHECQQKVDSQKIDSHSLVFMLLRIKESLDAYYNDYFQKINTFLVQAERITAEYYAHMNDALPRYGDYLKAIEAEKSESIDCGAGANVKKQELLNLVRTVTDNYYASGMFIKSGRMIFKDVNNSQPERKDIVNKMVTPLPKWMEFQDKVTAQLELIREQTFKISAYVDFLKQGEMKMAPTLDLTALSQTSDSSDNGKNTKPHSHISPRKLD